MNTVLMTALALALALAIVVGGCAMLIAAVVGMIWLFSKIDEVLEESAIEMILKVILIASLGGVFLASWYAAFSWIKGWL